MKIDRVTITGADDQTSIALLSEYSARFPFVEWGILSSPNRNPSPRYPSAEWMSELMKAKGAMNLSLHLCGEYAHSFVSGGLESIRTYRNFFRRFQININFTKSPYFDSDKVKNIIRSSVRNSFIFQANRSNAERVATILKWNLGNVDFLYDSSGGRGKLIDQVPDPFDAYTGYAGGLNPENIDDYCRKIYSSPWADDCWIDTETGVRDEADVLDMKKVEAFLFTCSKYVHGKHKADSRRNQKNYC